MKFLLLLLGFSALTSCSDGLLQFGSGSGGGGGVDSGGSIGTKLNGNVRTILVTTDGTGAIYIGGDFTSFGNVAVSRIARITVDGGLDTTFNPGSGFDNTVNQIVFDTGNSIYVVGSFHTYNGSTARGVVRIRSSGSIETGFGAIAGNTVTGIALVSSGFNSIILVGTFTSIGSSSANYMARLTSEGSVDVTFLSLFDSAGASPVKIIKASGSENYFAVGSFLSYSINPKRRVARIRSDAANDPAFANGPTDAANSLVTNVIQNSDGLYVTGNFTSYSTANAVRIARANPSTGAADAGFNPPVGGLNFVGRTLADASLGGKQIYVGGDFTSYGTSSVGRLIRLESDGSHDTNFAVAGFNNSVIALGVDSNGLVYAGGSFNSYGTTESNALIRLHTNGTVDTSF